MKRTLFAAIATILVAMTFTGCQIYSIVKDATDKEDGRIIMKDGKEYVGRVEMPNVNTKRLTIVTDNEKKNIVEANDIEALVIWKKTHPENKHVLKYMPSWQWHKKNKQRKPLWMALIASGPYVDFYACSFDFTISSNGTLKVTSVKGGNIEYAALKKGDKVPQVVSMTDISKRQKRKSILEYLNDDPALAKKLNEQDINPNDFDTIAETYHP